jgi:hypothetical protein
MSGADRPSLDPPDRGRAGPHIRRHRWDDSGLPILTAIQVLLEEAQKAAPEKGGRGTRYDRHEELSPDDDQPDA